MQDWSKTPDKILSRAENWQSEREAIA